MIYGTPFPHVVRDITDLIGIRTLVLRQYWQPEGDVRSQADVDGAKPGVPGVPGGVMLMGEQTTKERGRYATYWTFQGVNGDGSGVTFKDRDSSIDYGFEPGFAQVPIQVHKDFLAMLDRFEGYPGNDGATVIWPPELSDNAKGSALSTGRKKDTTNPMFGIQAFFEMEGVYRFRYASRTLPASLDKGVGFIAESLPGNPKTLREGSNWLKAPPAYQRKGVVYDITEFYWASRRGGWPEPVYREGYFQE